MTYQPQRIIYRHTTTNQYDTILFPIPLLSRTTDSSHLFPSFPFLVLFFLESRTNYILSFSSYFISTYTYIILLLFLPLFSLFLFSDTPVLLPLPPLYTPPAASPPSSAMIPLTAPLIFSKLLAACDKS